MAKFRVSIHRTSLRIKEIEVEADDMDHAENVAMDKAGNIDFNDARESGVEYEAYAEEEISR